MKEITLDHAFKMYISDAHNFKEFGLYCDFLKARGYRII
jgi:hypothetical protein